MVFIIPWVFYLGLAFLCTMLSLPFLIHGMKVFKNGEIDPISKTKHFFGVLSVTFGSIFILFALFFCYTGIKSQIIECENSIIKQAFLTYPDSLPFGCKSWLQLTNYKK